MLIMTTASGLLIRWSVAWEVTATPTSRSSVKQARIKPYSLKPHIFRRRCSRDKPQPLPGGAAAVSPLSDVLSCIQPIFWRKVAM